MKRDGTNATAAASAQLRSRRRRRVSVSGHHRGRHPFVVHALATALAARTGARRRGALSLTVRRLRLPRLRLADRTAPQLTSTVRRCEGDRRRGDVETRLPRVLREHSVAALSANPTTGSPPGAVPIPCLRARQRPLRADLLDDGFALVAPELNTLDSRTRRSSNLGRTSNEAAFLYQLFAARTARTTSDCRDMCHDSSGWPLSEVIGIGKGTVTLHDSSSPHHPHRRQNPGTNHRACSPLRKAAQRGATHRQH